MPEPEASTMSAATYPSLATDGNGRVVSAVGGLSPPVLAPPVGFMPPMGFPEARRPAPKPAAKPDQRHGRWTEEERVAPRPGLARAHKPLPPFPHTKTPIPRHAEFLELMQRYGRSWTKISSVMKTRTEPQVRSHAQKHFLRINKEEGVDPAAKRPRTNAGGHLAPNELPRHLAAGSPDAAHVAAFGRSATPWTGPSPYASYGAPAYGGVYPQAGFVPPGPYGAHPGAYVGAPPNRASPSTRPRRAIARERAATSAAPAPAKDGAPTPRSRRSSPKRTSPSSSAAPRRRAAAVEAARRAVEAAAPEPAAPDAACPPRAEPEPLSTLAAANIVCPPPKDDGEAA
ncbi:hypothetical protein JL720_10224 [Aureococcus anophagefferens]|nr:hypothetical protein JL720_10224 [Aureococcus anophagefferens]